MPTRSLISTVPVTLGWMLAMGFGSVQARTCPPLTQNTPLPITVGSLTISGPAGAQTLGNKYIPLGNTISISFNGNVTTTQIELFTQRQTSSVPVVVSYSDGSIVTNQYMISNAFGNVPFVQYTNGATRIEVRGSDADTWLVSVCDAQ